MPVNQNHRVKARTVGLMMKNPEINRMVRDAWDAPIGSTKRQSAKSTLSIMTKLHGAPVDTGRDEYNPWKDLPPYRPVLNYAKTAPKPRSGSMDGEGGGGAPPANWGIQSGSISGQMDPRFSTPAARAANQAYIEEQARKKSEGLFSNAPQYNGPAMGGISVPSVSGPPAPSRTFGPSMPSSGPAQGGITSQPSSFGSGVMLSASPGGRSIDDIFKEIEDKKRQEEEAKKNAGLFSVSGNFNPDAEWTTPGGPAVRPEISSIVRNSMAWNVDQPTKNKKELTGAGIKVPPGGSKTSLDKSGGYQPRPIPIGPSKSTKIDPNDLQAAMDQLQHGKDWGTVWGALKARYPKIANSNIDTALGADWREPGAFTRFKVLGTPKIPKMTTNEERQAVLAKFNDPTYQKAIIGTYQDAQKMFQSGAKWGDVWNGFRARAPKEFSNSDIDAMLGVEWRNPGAYELYKQTGSPTGAPQSQSQLSVTAKAPGEAPGGQTAGPANNLMQGVPNQPQTQTPQVDYTAGSGQPDTGFDWGSFGMSGIGAGLSASSAGNAPGGTASGSYSGGGTIGPVPGGQFDLNSIPGLNIGDKANSDLSMTAYETKALSALANPTPEIQAAWEKNFPGVPLPPGASLSGSIDNLIAAKRKDLGLDDLLKKQEQMLQENPSFVLDARDYIVQHDQQLKEIDSMLDKENSLAVNEDLIPPDIRDLHVAYRNYLNMMKGKTSQRYASYLNRAVDLRNKEATQLDSQINRAQQELQMASASIQNKATEDYQRILKIIDENAQKPALMQQMAQQNAKDARAEMRETIATMKDIKSLTDTNSKDDSFLANVNKFVSAFSDPATKAWNSGQQNLSELLNTYAADGMTPDVLIEVMKRVMPRSIDEKVNDKRTGKNVAGGLKDTLDLVDQYTGSLRSFNDDLETQIKTISMQNKADPRLPELFGTKGKLEQVQKMLSASNQLLFQDELSKNWQPVQAAINDLKASSKYAGLKKTPSSQFTPQEKADWMKKWGGDTPGKVDPDLLSKLWEVARINSAILQDPRNKYSRVIGYNVNNFAESKSVPLTPTMLAKHLVAFYEELSGIPTDL